MELKDHWDKVYTTKQLNEVSWYQPTPTTSLQLIEEFKPDFNAQIIDIGGGDSFLVDNLVKLGFQNISILDISNSALKRCQERLGVKANNVDWICSDISQFKPKRNYDLWHDRAAFHFLTDTKLINEYVHLVNNNIKSGGLLILGTFSDKGPQKCSGLEISQYSPEQMTELFSEHFDLEKTFMTDHDTPFNTVQNFTFGVFRKK